MTNRTALPARITVYTCSRCGVFLGIADVARIRHEHFEEHTTTNLFGGCKGAHYEKTEYVVPDGGPPTGVNDEMLDALLLARKQGYEDGLRDASRSGAPADSEEHGD